MVAPSPDLISVDVPNQGEVDEPFTVTIIAENDANTGYVGSSITASVLYSDGSDDLSISNVSVPWAINSPLVYAPGYYPIWHRTDGAMTAQDYSY